LQKKIKLISVIINQNLIGISLDETTSQKDVLDIVVCFAESLEKNEAEIAV
jgi:hypothetical protein